jgi:dTDP-4-amino-4,6-dideoxygalactose transaminase
VDIKLETLAMNPDDLLNTVSQQTVAVVHIGNNGVIGSDIEMIKEICDENGVCFLEDSAPSMLQFFNGKRAGCFGDLAIYSFSATKPVTCGEGGVILTDNKEYYDKLKVLRHTPKYYNLEPSLNFCLSPFLAAYLLPQLNDDYINESLVLRETIHETYKSFGLEPFENEGVTNRYGAVMYLSKKASTISKRFDTFGVEHRYQHYTLYDDPDKFPISKMVIDQIIDLPSHYHLKEEEIMSVCNIIKMVEKNAKL